MQQLGASQGARRVLTVVLSLVRLAIWRSRNPVPMHGSLLPVSDVGCTVGVLVCPLAVHLAIPDRPPVRRAVAELRNRRDANMSVDFMSHERTCSRACPHPGSNCTASEEGRRRSRAAVGQARTACCMGGKDAQYGKYPDGGRGGCEGGGETNRVDITQLDRLVRCEDEELHSVPLASPLALLAHPSSSVHPSTPLPPYPDTKGGFPRRHGAPFLHAPTPLFSLLLFLLLPANKRAPASCFPEGRSFECLRRSDVSRFEGYSPRSRSPLLLDIIIIINDNHHHHHHDILEFIYSPILDRRT